MALELLSHAPVIGIITFCSILKTSKFTSNCLYFVARGSQQPMRRKKLSGENVDMTDRVETDEGQNKEGRAVVTNFIRTRISSCYGFSNDQ